MNVNKNLEEFKNLKSTQFLLPMASHVNISDGITMLKS